MVAGEAKNNELGDKNEKGEGKNKKNYIKNVEKGLKKASFGVINSNQVLLICDKKNSIQPDICQKNWPVIRPIQCPVQP